MAGPDDAPSADVTVITTHINADFDALASLLAAQKLYPDARVVFPGSQEKNLRTFFISSLVYLFNMTDVQAVDLARVKRLVLVDTRQAGRIGRSPAWSGAPGWRSTSTTTIRRAMATSAATWRRASRPGRT